MKKLLSTLFIAGLLALAPASSASAHFVGPCDDTDGDGQPSGVEYAQHHIASGAKLGIIGQGHKPGEHQGFSECDPSSL